MDWHPCTSLLASCGRDAMVKLWDARLSPDTAMLATLQGHKQTVNKVGGRRRRFWNSKQAALLFQGSSNKHKLSRGCQGHRTHAQLWRHCLAPVNLLGTLPVNT